MEIPMSNFFAVNHSQLSDDLALALPNYRIAHYPRTSVSHKTKQVKGTKHLYRLRSEHLFKVGNDLVTPMVVLRDQTFPGAALRLHVGLYRLVCSNGLLGVAISEPTVRIPHFTNRKDQLEGIAAAIFEASSRMESVIETANTLTTIQVKAPTTVIESLSLPPTLTELLLSGITQGAIRPEDDINTVWGLYNYVNETMFSRTRSVFAAVERDTTLVNQIITVNAA
jgi:hypothetical protein